MADQSKTCVTQETEKHFIKKTNIDVNQETRKHRKKGG